MYLLLVAAQPFLALYHEGYVRLSCMPYDEGSSEMCIHLTNQYQQKKHPLYEERKEETVRQWRAVVRGGTQVLRIYKS